MNFVITKKLKNGRKLVIVRVNGIFDYVPKYSELRDVIKQLRLIYGDKEVNQELNLKQKNRTNIDHQDENEKEYVKENFERMKMLVEKTRIMREKGILYDFSKSPIFDYDKTKLQSVG